MNLLYISLMFHDKLSVRDISVLKEHMSDCPCLTVPPLPLNIWLPTSNVVYTVLHAGPPFLPWLDLHSIVLLYATTSTC